MGLDILLYKMQTSASQLVAMLSDFIPESLALGGAFALGVENALLLAVLMALQNVPEGFNAYRELRGSSSYGRTRIILMFATMALLGPVAGVAGYLWLADYPTLMAALAGRTRDSLLSTDRAVMKRTALEETGMNTQAKDTMGKEEAAGKPLRSADEMRLHERFDERIDAGEFIEPKDWMPDHYR